MNTALSRIQRLYIYNVFGITFDKGPQMLDFHLSLFERKGTFPSKFTIILSAKRSFLLMHGHQENLFLYFEPFCANS